MAAFTIPLRNDMPVAEFQVELDGQTFTIEQRWNFRSEQWTFSLADALGVPIFEGVGGVVDFPLGRRVQDERMPPGFLMLKDTAGQHREATFQDLGLRVQLIYMTRDELVP